MRVRFQNEPYVRRLEKPWGWEIHWVPDGKPYMGKILHIRSGQRISLQYHDEKQESWYLVSGSARIIWENDDGVFENVLMEPGVGYSVDLAQKHRLVAVTDCDIVEASTPEIGTTFRIEDDYSRNDESEEARLERNAQRA